MCSSGYWEGSFKSGTQKIARSGFEYLSIILYFCIASHFDQLATKSMANKKYDNIFQK